MDMFNNRGRKGREPVDYSILLPDKEVMDEEEGMDVHEEEDDDVEVETTMMAPSNVLEARPTPPDKCSSVVSLDSIWTGNIDVGDSIRIEGRLSGEVKAEHTVHISEGAEVDAKIEAAFLVVNGSFSGQIRCRERLELMPRSKIKGSVTTRLLTVHEGAFIDGEIHMTSAEQAQQANRTASRSSVSPSRNHVEAPEHSDALTTA